MATYLQDAIREFDKAHDDVEIKLADANGDPARLLNDAETFIDQKVDALLVFQQIQILLRLLAKKRNEPVSLSLLSTVNH